MSRTADDALGEGTPPFDALAPLTVRGTGHAAPVEVVIDVVWGALGAVYHWNRRGKGQVLHCELA